MLGFHGGNYYFTPEGFLYYFYSPSLKTTDGKVKMDYLYPLFKFSHTKINCVPP